MPFPGVYATVSDNSFNNGLPNQFSVGLIGPSTRGAFNTAQSVGSVRDFATKFGGPVAGNSLAVTVSAVTSQTSAVSVVRVGRQYATAIASASGSASSYNLFTSASASLTTNDYVRVSQPGKLTTVNARVQSVGVGTITLVSSGSEAVALADTYTTATVERSSTSGAANQAENILTTPIYGAGLSLGTVAGSKNAYQFTVTSGITTLVVNDVIKIEQSGRATTRQAVVTAIDVVNNIVSLLTVTNTETGQQAIALQDNYTAATVYRQASYANGMVIRAATAGTWANTSGTTAGLAINVTPGSNPDTKKLLVYLSGSLVATFDNLSMVTTSADYWVTRLAGSDLVNVKVVLVSSEPPANTINPWNSAYSSYNLGNFAGGFDGSTGLTAADYVGTVDTAGVPTGLKVFDDPESFELYCLAAPGITDAAVTQELLRIAGKLGAFVPFDIPDNIGPRDAVDFQNGAGLYTGYPRIDNFRGAYLWNWFQTTNPFNGLTEWAPPSCGYLYDIARVWNQYAPWYAAAGEQRGAIDIAEAVRYTRVSSDVKDSFQDGGNVLNPVLYYRGRQILLWGNRTSQRGNSKLSSISVVHLVNYIVRNMSALARKYVFDPNDDVLLDQLNVEFTSVLDQVQSRRGLETYSLVVDGTNNTAATRNARTVVVDLAIVPTDVAEVIKLNISVNQSGAVLNAVAGV